VYYLSIEAAYAILDPKLSPLIRSLRDVFRQAMTMVIATTYFKEVITTNMAIGYGIALAGQLLQSYGRPPPPTSPKGTKKRPQGKKQIDA
jgi:hypothetical protein